MYMQYNIVFINKYFTIHTPAQLNSWHTTYYFPTLLLPLSVVHLLGYNLKVGIPNILGFPTEINRSLALDCFILIS